jgi:hypothetical protein
LLLALPLLLQCISLPLLLILLLLLLTPLLLFVLRHAVGSAPGQLRTLLSRIPLAQGRAWCAEAAELHPEAALARGWHWPWGRACGSR